MLCPHHVIIEPWNVLSRLRACSRRLQCWASWSALCWSAQPPPRWSASCTCWVWCSVSVTQCWASLFWPGATASAVIRAFHPTAHFTVQTHNLVLNPVHLFGRLLLWHHHCQAGVPTDGDICLLRRHHFQYPCLFQKNSLVGMETH